MTLDYKNIIVGIDGSKEAEAAFKKLGLKLQSETMLHYI